MAERAHLLCSREMARFAARGFLRFDEIVPRELCERFVSQYDDGGLPRIAAGTPLARACRTAGALGEILELPRVQGIVESTVGPRALVDHHFVHVRRGGGEPSQPMHQDSTIDPRLHFDVQLMFFPERVTRETGGTYFVPGSHLRRVNESSIARYQNVLGTKHVTCEPGTIFAFHMGIWHGGGCNRGDVRRLAYKIRLNPTVRQSRLWNTDDLPEDHATPQPIFVPDAPWDREDIQTILCTPERWFEHDASRLEFINRIRFWRFLLGDETFDAHYWLTRLENRPA